MEEEYLETIDFPVKWDIGAPMPHLLTNGRDACLFFYLKDEIKQGNNRIEQVALVKFHHCLSSKIGIPDENTIEYHALYRHGIEPYRAQIVHNSKWIKELELLAKHNSHYEPEIWERYKHYAFWFHDESFECVARTYEVEVFRGDLDEIFKKVARRILV